MTYRGNYNYPFTFSTFLGQRYVCFMSSQIRLSVCLTVTLVHPTQRVDLFGNTFAQSNVLEIRTVCVKMLESRPNCTGFYVTVQVKLKGAVKKWRFSTNISLYSRTAEGI